MAMNAGRSMDVLKGQRLQRLCQKTVDVRQCGNGPARLLGFGSRWEIAKSLLCSIDLSFR